MTKKLLLATVFTVMAVGSAIADNIVFTATVDNVLQNTTTSANGSLTLTNVSFGPSFNLNSMTVNAGPTFLAQPDILDTNTININQNDGGNHTLVLDIRAQNLVGPGTLQDILSEFSVTGLTSGWSVFGQTYINGVLQVTSPTVTANSALGSAVTNVLLTNPFEAEVKYTIMSVGIGQFNGGIDIARTAPVPMPIAGAGLPGLIAAGFFGFVGWRKRRQANLAV
jgi:hypothetical protein